MFNNVTGLSIPGNICCVSPELIVIYGEGGSVDTIELLTLLVLKYVSFACPLMVSKDSQINTIS